jgi:acyl carrier protein
MQVTESQLIHFISNELGVAPDSLSLNTRFKQDLGLRAEDVLELLMQISQEYNIELEAFRFNDYFIPAQNLGIALSYLLSVFGNSKPLKPFKIMDIFKVINARP